MPKTNVDIISTQYRMFNDFVRGEIRRRDETQEGLASYLGMTRSNLSYLLSGRIEWKFRDFLKTCEYFGKNPSEIL